jgi:flagellar biosynthesis/type III secretory pathway chaperone
MENLIDVLERESSEYEGLLELSERKTTVIVSNNLEDLNKIMDEEQELVSRISNLEKKREEVIADIANVLNKDVKTLKLKDLIEILADRPQERKPLEEVHDRLRDSVRGLKRVNEQNMELLKNAMDMVKFDLNLLQSMKAAPETANYNRGAYSAGDTMGIANSGFDAKQ